MTCSRGALRNRPFIAPGALRATSSILLIAASSLLAHNLEGYSRVRETRSKYQSEIERFFRVAGMEYPADHLFLRAFKLEQVLEVWAADSADTVFSKVIEYPFTGSSGELGPKRAEGDLQIPEGFYVIDQFNPTSKYAYVALRLNYPNEAD